MINRIVILLLTLPFIFVSCIKDDIEKPEEGSSLIVEGDAVPSFTISDGMGGTFSSIEFKGKRSLLVFFHTSCSDCERELPRVEEAWKVLKSESDIQVIAIAREETLNTVKKFWEDKKLTYPFYLDTNRSIYAQFAKSTIPRLYAINPQGEVTWMAIETVTESVEEIIEIIRKQ